MYDPQFAFFGELALGGISLFSLAHGRWRSRPGQPAQAARPNIKSMRSLSMLVRIMAAYSKRGAILLRDSGRS